MARWNTISHLVDALCPESCIGVEIGVHHAATTHHLVQYSQKLGFLYAVDPYIDRDHRYYVVQNKLHKFTQCMILRMTSESAANFINSELDFVFIDGDHHYEAVLLDLEKWVPKLKPGGLLMGHDWCRKKEDVVKAGTEYMTKNDHLFKPLVSKEELISMQMNLPDDERRFMDFYSHEGLVHRQNRTAWPIWWRIKN